MKLIPLPLLVMLLAGCSSALPGAPSPAYQEPPHSIVPPGATAEDAIVVGTTWQYVNEAGVAVSLVVSSIVDQGFRIDTTNQGEAFWDARFDNPLIGEFPRFGTANYQGEDLQLLPPSDSVSWTAMWGTRERRHDASVDGDITSVQVHDDLILVATYSFSAITQTFNSLQLYDDSGAVSKSLQIVAGPVVAPAVVSRYHLEQVVDQSYKEAGGPMSSSVFSPTGNETDLWFDMTVACEPAGAYAVVVRQIGDPGSQAINEVGACSPTPLGLGERIIEAPAAGQWILAATIQGQQATLAVAAYLRTYEEAQVTVA